MILLFIHPVVAMTRLVLSFGLVAVVLLAAFTARLADSGAPTLPPTPYNYAAIELPAHLLAPTLQLSENTPSNNPVTDAGATLGRVLFYDTRLSLNQTVACASCHLQARGFSDTTAFSTGFAGEQTSRNAMSLANIRFYHNARFFWDERGLSLEETTVLPIENPIEMGATLPEVIARMQATTFYPGLFADAFGTPEITSERMGQALAQFLRSIVSYRTRYDEGRAQVSRVGQDFPNFTVQENRGKTLFTGVARCNRCHTTDAFIAPNPFNNGLDLTTTDPGVGGITGAAKEESLFKFTSLRNIELTAPYMHDGRFATLEQVIEHYNSGVQAHPNLSTPLKEVVGPGPSPPARLNLSEADKAALVAFLRTLTDVPMTTDERWSNPFSSTDPPPPPPPPTVTLALTPQTVTLPPGGGAITYTATINNPTAAAVAVTLSTTLTLPDGNVQGVGSAVTITAASGQSTLLSRRVRLGANQPAGTYLLTETLSGDAAAQGSFTLEKQPAAGAAAVAGVPTVYTLDGAYPNPFRSAAVIRFGAPEATEMTIEMLDVLGRRVATLLDGSVEAGLHGIRWEAEGLPAGIYFVRMHVGDAVQTRSVTLIR